MSNSSGNSDQGELPPRVELTPEQRERLHRVQERLGQGHADSVNPGLDDTPDRLSQAFFWGFRLHSKQQR